MKHHYLNDLSKTVNIINFIFLGEGFDFSGVPPDDYISFYGMRARDILMGTLVSEELFIAD
jgi:hypothetical protein